MSELAVQLTTIDEVKPHSNADRLEIAVVGGWQCVVPKGVHTAGENIIYFPPDTVLPQKWTDHLGVTQYCHLLKDGRYRIRCARLRGEPSFGVLVDSKLFGTACTGWVQNSILTNQNIIEYFEATKYVPPITPFHGTGGSDGLAEVDDPLFSKYTAIENIRNHPDVVFPGEEITITEKIHGTNCRVGVVNGQLMAGSHNRRVKVPEQREEFAMNRYCFPLSLPNVRELLTFFSDSHSQVVLFGEVFGAGVQQLDYGRKGIDFIAFDLLIDGAYVAPEAFASYCSMFDVTTAPALPTINYTGIPDLKRFVDGRSLLGGTHIREGIVIKPTTPRTDPRIGRVVLKHISDAYLLKLYDDISES